MFNLFIQLCFNVLTEILVVRTNEIYFLFYDLFILKLEKLERYCTLHSGWIDICSIQLTNSLIS